MKNRFVRQRQHPHGFNLIEAAIVLAVVGLVIGGVWVAAASVNYKLQIQDTAKGMLQAVQSLRSLYGNSACPGTTTDISPVNINLGIVSTWPPMSSMSVKSPIGSEFVVQMNCNGSSGASFALSLVGNFTYDQCLSLVGQLGIKRDSDGFGINDGNFLLMGGSGRCISSMSSMSFYWRY